MLKIVLPCWFGLGACRGVQMYNANHNFEKKNNNNKRYSLSECINWSFAAGTFYFIPFAVPHVLKKEMYRAKVMFYNRTEEKNTIAYYKLI